MFLSDKQVRPLYPRRSYNKSMKICKNCGNTLSGRQKMFCSVTCKDKFKSRDYYKKNKEKINLITKKYREEHKKSISENKKRYYKRHRKRLLATRKIYNKEHPETNRRYKQAPKGKLMIYKRGARKRNLEFELTLEYFKENWNKKCKYCGSDIKGVGFDRVDNSKGYTIENIVNCCEMCNRMKLNYSEEDFINQCIKIANI